jgi:hypothetical protein
VTNCNDDNTIHSLKCSVKLETTLRLCVATIWKRIRQVVAELREGLSSLQRSHASCIDLCFISRTSYRASSGQTHESSAFP